MECFADGHLRSVSQLSAVVDAAVSRAAPKPERQMRSRLDLSDILIQFQKNVLCNLLGKRRRLEKVIGNAEDEVLVFQNQLRKSCSVPGLRTGQRAVYVRLCLQAPRPFKKLDTVGEAERMQIRGQI
jgi:hypothetical protein